MNKLYFYEVDVTYTDFLRKYGDHKIPYIRYSENDRFLCGVLFEINGMNYFAPISSYRHPQKSNIILKDHHGSDIGSIRFSYMFPVPLSLVRQKDFTEKGESYQRLLDEEYNFCTKNSQRIISKAKHIYQNVKGNKDSTLVKNCCDFNSLEKAYHLYCILFDV
jgi:protein AbiQ